MKFNENENRLRSERKVQRKYLSKWFSFLSMWIKWKWILFDSAEKYHQQIWGLLWLGLIFFQLHLQSLSVSSMDFILFNSISLLHWAMKSFSWLFFFLSRYDLNDDDGFNSILWTSIISDYVWVLTCYKLFMSLNENQCLMNRNEREIITMIWNFQST